MRVEKLKELHNRLKNEFGNRFENSELALDELTCELPKSLLLELCTYLKDTEDFEQLTDLCGVDYLTYQKSEWVTQDATRLGFGRSVNKVDGVDFLHDNTFEHTQEEMLCERRFAVVYHLLSIKQNLRIRLRVFLDADDLIIPSVHLIWPCADWYEREAFDLYGILFDGHPDLRRILTDYGFIGHPFRKDFPLSGKVEVRYDKTQGRVIYEPVDIEPRVLVPKVVRDDYRFDNPDEVVEEAGDSNG